MHPSKQPILDVKCTKPCAKTKDTMWIHAKGKYPVDGIKDHRRLRLIIDGQKKPILVKVKRGGSFKGDNGRHALDVKIITEDDLK